MNDTYKAAMEALKLWRKSSKETCPVSVETFRKAIKMRDEAIQKDTQDYTHGQGEYAPEFNACTCEPEAQECPNCGMNGWIVKFWESNYNEMRQGALKAEKERDEQKTIVAYRNDEIYRKTKACAELESNKDCQIGALKQVVSEREETIRFMKSEITIARGEKEENQAACERAYNYNKECEKITAALRTQNEALRARVAQLEGKNRNSAEVCIKRAKDMKCILCEGKPIEVEIEENEKEVKAKTKCPKCGELFCVLRNSPVIL